MVTGLLISPSVPAKPVKSTFLAVWLADPKNVKAYVPAVKLNEIELASACGEDVTVLAVEPELVMVVMSVPVIVRKLLLP
jgi:hypothetical protein